MKNQQVSVIIKFLLKITAFKRKTQFFSVLAVGALVLFSGCGNKKVKLERYSVQELAAKVSDLPEAPMACTCIKAVSDEQYADSILFEYHAYTLSCAEIHTWYEAQMERLGWSKEFDWHLAGVHMCFKKGKKYCLIHMYEHHKKQIVTVQMGKKAS